MSPWMVGEDSGVLLSYKVTVASLARHSASCQDMRSVLARYKMLKFAQPDHGKINCGTAGH